MCTQPHLTVCVYCPVEPILTFPELSNYSVSNATMTDRTNNLSQDSKAQVVINHSSFRVRERSWSWSKKRNQCWQLAGNCMHTHCWSINPPWTPPWEVCGSLTMSQYFLLCFWETTVIIHTATRGSRQENVNIDHIKCRNRPLLLLYCAVGYFLTLCSKPCNAEHHVFSHANVVKKLTSNS